MPAIRLPAEARDAPVDAEGLAMTVRLTTHQIEQLWQGETVTASDAPIERLARALGIEVAALLVSSVATANDGPQSAANDDRDPVYSDDGPVMAAETSGTSRVEREPVDMAAVFERTLEQLVAESAGRYNEDDAELVVGLLSMGDLPPSLTAREVPGLLTAWLEPASEMRRHGRAQPELVLALVRDEGSKTASKMARGIIAKLDRAKASKAPKKGK